MNSGVIATRYVRAIERYARKADRSELLYEELDRLTAGFEQAPGIGKTLCDPTLPLTEKHTAVCRMAGDTVSREFSRIIDLVLRNGRAAYLHTIARLFCNRYRRAAGICRLRLTTARTLPPEQTERIRTFAKTRLRAESIEFRTDIRPELLGGFRLETDDLLFDATVAGRLAKIERTLQSLN